MSTAIVLSHRYQGRRPGDVIDVPDIKARQLVNAGYARHLEDVITPTGGGWYEVPTSDGPVKVRGLEDARKRLIREARRR